MDEVEGGFVGEAEAVGEGLAGGGVEGDEDFAVVEGDDVGGGGVVEEFAMDGGDLGVGHEGDFDFGEAGEDVFGGEGGGEAGGEGVVADLFEASEAGRGELFCVRGDVDFDDWERGGCRGEHDGVGFDDPSQAAEADLPVGA